MQMNDFFRHLWQDYTAMTPQAAKIFDAFTQQGETVENDHVAFRTYNLSPINLEVLEQHFLALGYKRYAPYDFKEKKLSAYGYLHSDASQPRIFLSELRVEELSETAQGMLKKLVDQVNPDRVKADPSVLWAGRLWDAPSYQDYQTLLEESEYAAWVASIGLRTNHFTISVNGLDKFPEVVDVVAEVERLGLAINESGGKLKGSPEVLLVQASTLADRMPVTFANNETHVIPTCYYEFAKRYVNDQGELYQGFVAASADRIFESTQIKQRKG